MNAIEPDEYGPRLYAYLDAHWRAQGTNANAWVNQHPQIQGPTVSRWKTGSVPSLQAMRAVADALGVTMLDVLTAAGVLDPKEAKHKPAAPEPPSIDVALVADPNLSDFVRGTLTDILASLRALESGKGGSGARKVRAPRRPAAAKR